jgi:hypothetical protein
MKKSIEGPFLFRAIANLNWFSYSSHLVEALVQVLGNDPKTVETYGEGGESFVVVEYSDRRVGLIQIIDLSVLKTLYFSLHGISKSKTVDFSDIHSRVYPMLNDFMNIIKMNIPNPKSMEDTMAVMRILVGADSSRKYNGKRIQLEEFVLN